MTDKEWEKENEYDDRKTCYFCKYTIHEIMDNSFRERLICRKRMDSGVRSRVNKDFSCKQFMRIL